MAEENAQSEVEQVTGDKAPEVLELSEEELVEKSDADYRDGFNKVFVESDPAAAESETVDEVDPEEAARLKMLEGLPDRLRRMDGTIGGLKSQIIQREAFFDKTIKDLMAARRENPAEAAGPDSERVATALKDPEAMQSLMEDYPDFSVIGDEMQALRSDLAQQKSEIQQQIQQTEQQRLEQIQHEQIAAVHPDYQETIQSAKFNNWALEGGPSSEEYANIVSMLNHPDQRQVAQQVVETWGDQYTDWWTDRGKDLFDANATSSSRVLSKFKETSQQLSEKERRQKRIESTTVPDGRGAAPAPGLNDNEAFARGFAKVAKRR